MTLSPGQKGASDQAAPLFFENLPSRLNLACSCLSHRTCFSLLQYHSDLLFILITAFIKELYLQTLLFQFAPLENLPVREATWYQKGGDGLLKQLHGAISLRLGPLHGSFPQNNKAHADNDSISEKLFTRYVLINWWSYWHKSYLITERTVESIANCESWLPC
jgi:hypothetical protein